MRGVVLLLLTFLTYVNSFSQGLHVAYAPVAFGYVDYSDHTPSYAQVTLMEAVIVYDVDRSTLTFVYKTTNTSKFRILNIYAPTITNLGSCSIFGYTAVDEPDKEYYLVVHPVRVFQK